VPHITENHRFSGSSFRRRYIIAYDMHTYSAIAAIKRGGMEISGSIVIDPIMYIDS